MKTKKFLMTTLLVMGMVIAKAANGFPPELVLVSQPVLTYNANSVTVYYDVQNIGDYTYRGNIYIYLDPDDGYYYAKKRVRVCPGRIRRVAITIPAYRPNPSWVYTVMPYYELGDELYSFTTFEYFEPIRFHWYGYRDEPWVVIHVGPRPRHYHRPHNYRFYYDGYRPVLPPPPGGYPPGYFDGRPPLDPVHHTYGYHHHTGGYPANYHPEHETAGYNHVNDPVAPQASVRPSSGNTGGSMSSSSNTGSSNNAASGSMSGRTESNSSNTSSGSMSGRSESGSSRVSGSDSSRPSSSATSGRTDNGSSSSRNDNRSSGRTDNSSSSGRVSGSDSGRSSSSSSGRVSGSDSGRSSGTSSGRSSGSSSSSSSSGRSSGSSVSSSSSSSSSSSGRSSSSPSSSSGRASSSNASSGGRSAAGSTRAR